MVETLVNFLLNLIKELAKFGSWLTEPLPYIDQTPLSIFTFAGLTAVLVLLLIRLVIGG